MAFTTLTTIYGNPNDLHSIKIEYDLTSYTATTFSIQIRLTYSLASSSARLYTETGYDGSATSDAPYIKFSTESDSRYYARGSVTNSSNTISGPWSRIFYTGTFTNITRNGNAGAFTLTISGRERIINNLSNSPLENKNWSGTITIPAVTRSITYYKNDGTTTNTIRTVTYGDSHNLISLPSEWTRSGYIFLGWNSDNTATTGSASGTTISNITSDKIYYAIWRPYAVRICNGNDFNDKYVTHIYCTYNNVTNWYPHIPYIYTGSSWEIYGG